MKKLFIIALSFIVLGGLTSCFDAHKSQSKLPWSRPAKWENSQMGVKF